MGVLGILMEDTAIRWTNRRHHKTAMRQAREIAQQARRDITSFGRAADRAERRKVASAELPAGRMARTVHRAGQATSLAVTIAELLAAATTIRLAVHELRQPLPNKEVSE